MLLGSGRGAVGDLGIGTIAEALRPRVTDITVLHPPDGHPDGSLDGTREEPNVRITMTPTRAS